MRLHTSYHPTLAGLYHPRHVLHAEFYKAAAVACLLLLLLLLLTT
jgi:hypothetical protein